MPAATSQKAERESSVKEQDKEITKNDSSMEALDDSELDISVDDVLEYVIKCTLSVKKDKTDILLELVWIDGENYESLQQILQFFKNKFK